MSSFIKKIKAIAKILAGIVVASLIGNMVAFPIIIFTGAGIISLVIGAFIIITATAGGVYIGGIWARKNIADTAGAKSVAIWTATIFLIANIMLVVAGGLIMFLVGGESMNYLMRIIQIVIQSYIIYAMTIATLQQYLNKKTNSEII